MSEVLDWISGISWSCVYAVAFCFGIRKECYCIPAICVCLNFSWEACVVLQRILYNSPLDSGFIIQLLWFVLDIGVMYTWFKYSPMKASFKLLLFAGAAVAMVMVTLVIGLWEYVAFAINLLMSVVFLFHLDRHIYPLQSIAVFKCIGTLAATFLNGILLRDLVIFAIGGSCFLADILYIIELKFTKI